MHDHQERWDSAAVLELGALQEAELKVCRSKSESVNLAIEIELLDQTARALSRQGRSLAAIDYYTRGAAVCEQAGQFQRQGRTLSCKAELQASIGLYGDAKITFGEVHRLGEELGEFELYCKSCLGLSNVARLEGDLTKGVSLAYEALTAAGLLQNGQYGKARDTAKSILAIVKCSDLHAADFDESLLDRLVVLGTEIDLDDREGGGSVVCIQAAELQYTRHLSQGRLVQGAHACQEVVRFAKQDRFLNQIKVQSMAEVAKYG